MKKIFLFFIILFVLPVYAQVTTTPLFPMETDSITIVFDANKASRKDLVGYTGDLYTHTGVVTNLSAGQWSHVIGSWGNNQAQPKLTRLSTNLYELKIGYPRKFYSVTNTGETILKLAFVFRSADGSKQTEDIFVTIYKSGISVTVNNPPVKVEYGDPLRSPGFASSGETLPINISAVAIETIVISMKLFIDNNLKSESDSSRLIYNFIASDYSQGAHDAVVITADTGALRDTTRFILFVNPEITNAPPPAGTKPGINIHNDFSVTFSIFAPYKKFVYLLGSFNDWKVNTDYFLKKYEITPDSVIWHITLDGMTPGSERLFQYLVDGKIRIADPYSTKVLDPWNDQHIPPGTYFGLTPYPSGKTGYPVSAFSTGTTPYQWQTTDFVRPKKTDLIIYELLIRDFLVEHDYKTLRDTLMYLKNLGITAVELMPVNEFEGNESWGYNPSFYFAPDKYYGPSDDLKAFIDTAHELGMAVIVDMVLNHSYGQSPLVRLYWNEGAQRPDILNPWYNVVSPNPVFSWGYDFNHESIHTKNFVDRVNKYWLDEFKVDGFRFDFTKGFTNTPGDGSGHDNSRIAILTRMANEIFKTDSSIYVILEHFAPNSEETTLANNGMMLWGNMNYQFNEATMGYTSDLSWSSYKARGWSYPHLVTYMESHDEERLMFRNLQFGNSNGDYNIKDIRTALNRMKLASAFFILTPGPKMIWQFGELGYDVSINNPCRICNKPIRWYYYEDPMRNNLYKVVAALNEIKTEYDAFESSNFTWDYTGTVKKLKIVSPTMDVIVLGNFGVVNGSAIPYFTKSGTWYDFFSGDSISVGDPTAPIPLLPGEFHIYTDRRIPPPDPGILLEADDDLSSIESYDLMQNFPNPFNPVTTIKFQVPERSNITLRVYDVIGREIETLINEELSSGYYEVDFDAVNLSSGVYFYKLETSKYTLTKKMILLK